jgi:DNA-binding response OmpR family regulator
MYSILLVTNEMGRVRDLMTGLSRHGYSCTACMYADDVVSQDNRQYFNIVLIDISSISTRGDSTWHWFRRLKLRRPLPIIALGSSATLPFVITETGIDDFITKPWDIDELSARIKRLISRSGAVDGDKVIKAGDLIIDPVKCEAHLGGRLLVLTFKEYEMLKLLATNQGKVFTREALLNEVWGYDYFGGDRTVDVHIRRLRAKIEDPIHSFIETVRNIGYKFKPSTSGA